MSSIFEILLNNNRKNESSEIERLMSQINDLENRIDELENRIDELESDKASEYQIDSLENRIDELENQVSDLDNQDDSDIEQRLDKLENFAMVTESSLQAMFTSGPIGLELGIAFLENSLKNSAPLASQPLEELKERLEKVLSNLK